MCHGVLVNFVKAFIKFTAYRSCINLKYNFCNVTSSLNHVSEVHCPSPLVVADSDRENVGTIYATVVKYSCHPGKRFEDGFEVKHITCQENEMWTENQFTCEGKCG